MGNTNSYVQAVDNRYVSRVKIGESYTSMQSVVKRTMDDTLISTREPDAVGNILGAMFEAGVDAKRRDTTPGGNEAINCYYQFNENDDIIHPINRTGSGFSNGMGRVYNETFDEQQQILYLSFGVPVFGNPADFMRLAFDPALARLMNTGELGHIGEIGRFLGKVLGTVIMLPFIPIKFTLDVLAGNSTPSASRFYDFQPKMALYYKMVNVILAHLAVNMNLATTEELGILNGTPNILQKHGLDILTILNRKRWYDKLEDFKSPTTDELLVKLKEKPMFEMNGWGWGSGLMAGFTEAMLYVGFRVEKSADSSETASSTTKESQISQMINSQVSSGRDRTFVFNALKGSSIGAAVNTVYEAAEGLASGVLDSFNLQGGVEMLKGSGFVDIPEVWDSSSFSKSYTFDFQLRTPYGDPFSIFNSLYIPLAMLIAGAFPRAVGANAYTSPFLVRAYCQGMFAIPMGIIDSITIKRGSAEYGWSKDMLPTQIDVSLTIKDLSPIMYVAIADSAGWSHILGQNSTFQEYMLTLAGTNIAQRTLTWERVKLRAKALMKIYSNNKFNTLMQGFALANTKVGRAITGLWPTTKLPGAADLKG